MMATSADVLTSHFIDITAEYKKPTIQPYDGDRRPILQRRSFLAAGAFIPVRMSAKEPDMWIAGVSDEVRMRIQLVYMEMPEVRLTRQQIRRLLSLPVDACEEAIRALLTSGFLIESIEGFLVRGRTALAPRH
jgi:hypothetical protein